MIIRKLEFEDHRFDFKDGKYVMSYATQELLMVRILRLETDDGQVGWGEIVRKADLDLNAVMAREVPLLEALPGKKLSDMPALARQYRLSGKGLRGLAFGLESAYLDLLGRKSNQPLYALLGGKFNAEIPEYYSLSCGDAGSVASELEAAARDWQVVQIKLGVGDIATDRQRIIAALETLAHEQTILLDFNGALTVESSLTLFAEFDDPRIVWEEPCDNVDQNIEIAQRSGLPIMFDQCLENLDCIVRVVANGLAHSICIKPAFLGGLEPARAARDMCIDANMPMRVDGPWCGHIATAVCLHFAATIPPELLIAGCDLRQPFDLDDDWGGTDHTHGHRIKPFDTPGHGVQVPVK